MLPPHNCKRTLDFYRKDLTTYQLRHHANIDATGSHRRVQVKRASTLVLWPVSVTPNVSRAAQVLLENGKHNTQRGHNSEDLRRDLCIEVNLTTKNYRPYAGVRFGEILKADVPLIACDFVLVEKGAH